MINVNNIPLCIVEILNFPLKLKMVAQISLNHILLLGYLQIMTVQYKNKIKEHCYSESINLPLLINLTSGVAQPFLLQQPQFLELLHCITFFHKIAALVATLQELQSIVVDQKSLKENDNFYPTIQCKQKKSTALHRIKVFFYKSRVLSYAYQFDVRFQPILTHKSTF